jgi:hypothetical protein
MSAKSAVEMFSELVRIGYVTPARVDPSGAMMPTAQIRVSTGLAFSTPPMNNMSVVEGGKRAELERRMEGDTKGA